MDWKFVEACFVLFFRGLGAILKSRLAIALILVVGVLIYVGSQHPGTKAAEPPPKYLEIAPNAAKAPTEIDTSSRVYYVKDFSDDGKVCLLKDYWYFDKGRWTETKIALPLDRAVYGELKILKR